MQYLEVYRLYRQQIQHEDLLINHRVSWLVGSQAFLLTGYIFLVNQPTFYATRTGTALVAGTPDLSFSIDALLRTVETVRFTVVLFGLLISCCVASGVLAAMIRIRELLDDFAKRVTDFRALGPGLPADQVLMPTLIPRGRHRVLGNLPALVLILGCASVWLVLLLQVLGFSRNGMVVAVVLMAALAVVLTIRRFAGTKHLESLR